MSAFSVLQHLRDRRVTAFLHGAQGLFFESRDAPGAIAGRGIFVDRLAVREEIRLETVDQRNN